MDINHATEAVYDSFLSYTKLKTATVRFLPCTDWETYLKIRAVVPDMHSTLIDEEFLDVA